MIALAARNEDAATIAMMNMRPILDV